jgi:hypothetical protein
MHLHSKDRRLEVFEVRESRSRSRCPSITNLGSVKFKFAVIPGLDRVRESLMLMRGL